eukprot:CCRYP_006938-RA/>CCRYP_006938-RA protein AED:0.32 eAED:0.32 QI:0/0/0/1/1/1/2/0/301
MIKRSVLLPKDVTKTISETKNISMLPGKLQAQEVVTLRDLRLPEFDKNRRISQQKALVFDNDHVRYNVILGTNFLSKTGIKLNYSEGKMEWFDCSLPLRPPGGLDSKDSDAMEDMFFIQAEDELFSKDWLSCCATNILDAKYEWTDVAEVVDKQTHLNSHQKKGLLQVSQDNSKIFDGTLGLYPHRKYPLPIILDILRKRSGYEFYTKLDVSMQYYTIELDEESQDLCTIITPFSKYKYARLPMGLKCSLDIAQSIMESVLSGIEDADVYTHDIGVFSQDWDHHIKLLATILTRLREWVYY